MLIFQYILLKLHWPVTQAHPTVKLTLGFAWLCQINRIFVINSFPLSPGFPFVSSTDSSLSINCSTGPKASSLWSEELGEKNASFYLPSRLLSMYWTQLGQKSRPWEHGIYLYIQNVPIYLYKYIGSGSSERVRFHHTGRNDSCGCGQGSAVDAVRAQRRKDVQRLSTWTAIEREGMAAKKRPMQPVWLLFLTVHWSMWNLECGLWRAFFPHRFPGNVLIRSLPE